MASHEIGNTYTDGGEASSSTTHQTGDIDVVRQAYSKKERRKESEKEYRSTEQGREKRKISVIKHRWTHNGRTKTYEENASASGQVYHPEMSKHYPMQFGTAKAFNTYFAIHGLSETGGEEGVLDVASPEPEYRSIEELQQMLAYKQGQQLAGQIEFSQEEQEQFNYQWEEAYRDGVAYELAEEEEQLWTTYPPASSSDNI